MNPQATPVAYSREAPVFSVRRCFAAALGAAATTLEMPTVRETVNMYIQLRSVHASHKQKSFANIANMPLHFRRKPEGEERTF